ncbi:MAG: hypothetical protein K2G22_02255 [Eubacterium sp.]|nr:hypothetical protein [Eubacterium sp.]
MIIQTILSLLPFAFVFGIALAMHEKALKSERERERSEHKAQHRKQAKYDMDEMSVYAAYYGGYTYD